MIPWILYVTALGAVTGVIALLAERGLVLLGWPVRWVWLATSATTVAAPAVLFLWGGGGGPASGAPEVWSRLPVWTETSAAEALLLVGWAAASMVFLANIRLSGWTVRRNARAWRFGRLRGQPIFVSEEFGPGVLGAARPRIVLPAWVLRSEPWLERLVVRHEAEHVAAGDTRLLNAGVALIALVPWCLPLWWHLHRLRQAIETDCDARVVAATGRPREYAHALVEVAGRRTRELPSIPALAPQAGELERRIRLITQRTRPRSLLSGLVCLFAAAAIAVPATLLPPPARTITLSALRSEATPSFEIPRSAAVTLSVAPARPVRSERIE